MSLNVESDKLVAECLNHPNDVWIIFEGGHFVWNIKDASLNVWFNGQMFTFAKERSYRNGVEAVNDFNEWVKSTGERIVNSTFDVDFAKAMEAVNAAFKDGDGTPNIVWTKTTAEVADYFLNVLPPIYGNGCFACPEPYTSNHKGYPVFLTFRKVNREANTAEARYSTFKEIKEGKCHSIV